jgi:chromosome segregation ATPase
VNGVGTDGYHLDQTPIAGVMSLASRSRAAHYAQKNAALSKIFLREADLKAAKGKVHEYEEELKVLQEEVNVMEENLTKIETDMANLERLLQVQTHPSLHITASASHDSVDQLAGPSSPLEPA